jgi:hypothetical protein
MRLLSGNGPWYPQRLPTKIRWRETLVRDSILPCFCHTLGESRAALRGFGSGGRNFGL